MRWTRRRTADVEEENDAPGHHLRLELGLASAIKPLRGGGSRQQEEFGGDGAMAEQSPMNGKLTAATGRRKGKDSDQLGVISTQVKHHGLQLLLATCHGDRLRVLARLQ